MEITSESNGRLEYERATAIEADILLEPIKAEDEDYESAPPDFNIVTFPADYTLEVLYSKWKSGEINIPSFQRSFVWKQAQASKLIESFLVGLPVPAIFLYNETKSQQLFVIDGQQRLKSIFYFFEGYFGEPEDDKRKIFLLTGLNQKSCFFRKTYKDMEDEDQRKLKNKVLRSFIVQQIDPDDDTSMYHIFERLNTGGTLLTNQEVRNCVYNGSFVSFLDELNHYEKWRRILGKPDPDTRKRDIELLLRFFAMRNLEAYEKPLKDFLSKYMRKNRNPSDEVRNSTRVLFCRTCDTILKYLGDKPFHIRAGLNAAVFDAVMSTVSNHLDAIPSNLNSRYEGLKRDPDFEKATRESTTDKERIGLRFARAESILFE
ncbi:MAG: DUF262 domain-containing protein [Syntrophales bacterium]|nr:DUF262 domain-containing protein [Syntrophales bacterium]